MAPPVFKTGLAGNTLAGRFDSFPPPPFCSPQSSRRQRSSSMSEEFWYRCPNCDEKRFPYTPNYEREGGHCGHMCLKCGTQMDWDARPDMDGEPQECKHPSPSLKKPGSVLPIKVD